MKKLWFTAVLAALSAACMFKPLPAVPTLGDVQLPVAAEEEAVWTSSDYKGKPVFVVFMGSWCPYCKMTMPAVQAMAEEFDGKAEVVAVFMDEDPEAVKNAAKEHNFTVKALYDGGNVAQSMEVNGLPHAVIFDKKHRAVQTWEGFKLTLADEFREQLTRLTK